jgi:hypothetical protein
MYSWVVYFYESTTAYAVFFLLLLPGWAAAKITRYVHEPNPFYSAKCADPMRKMMRRMNRNNYEDEIDKRDVNRDLEVNKRTGTSVRMNARAKVMVV